MKRNLGVAGLLVVASLTLVHCASTDTPWPAFMPAMAPGPSASPVPIAFPADIAIERPSSGVPERNLRWLGKWRGWACRDKDCEVGLLVSRVTLTEASVVFLFTSATRGSSTRTGTAQFVGSELQVTFLNGPKVAYRIRTDKVIEMYSTRDGFWIAGVLSKVD